MKEARFGLRVVLVVVSCIWPIQLQETKIADIGIDMTIEYAAKNFDQRLVELSCRGLDFDFEGRSQLYKEPLHT